MPPPLAAAQDRFLFVRPADRGVFVMSDHPLHLRPFLLLPIAILSILLPMAAIFGGFSTTREPQGDLIIVAMEPWVGCATILASPLMIVGGAKKIYEGIRGAADADWEEYERNKERSDTADEMPRENEPDPD
jgi:hypothetical protein